jgi:hypothetical protein
MSDGVRTKALDWLRSKDPAAVVGQRGRPGCCPLANMLRELASAPDPAIFAGTYRLERQAGRTFPLGGWARAAVIALDASGARCSEATAAEVLRIWEGIPDD